jgi:epoxyqueuosine reductase
VCQTTCPWNIKYATLLPAGSPFAPREALEGKDARQLARELLGMSQGEFGVAFKVAPIKRAKLRGLKRNAAVVLGTVGSEVDVDVLTRALHDEEPLVREHAAWALARIEALIVCDGETRRWVVERTFAWLGQSRRLSKDYERLPAVSEAMMYGAMSRLMLRRLTRQAA